MHNLKTILALLSSALLPACLVADFDEIESGTSVHSDGKGGAEVAGFGAAIIPTGGAEGLNYYVVATTAPTVVHVNFDEDGNRSNFDPEALPGTFVSLLSISDTPTVASDLSSFAGSNPTVAIGIAHQGEAKVATLNATFDLSAATPGARVQPGTITLNGSAEPTGLAFGNTDASVDTTDLVAISENRLNLVTDYQVLDPVVIDCSLPEAGGEVLVSDLGAAAGEEVVVANAARVFVATGTELQGRTTMACELGVEIGTEVTAPAGATSFGHALAVGDFGGTALPDLVIADPENNAVYVYMDWTVEAPTAATKLATPTGSVAFGTTLAVGDFDDDGKDELVVGDPKKKIAAHPEAGTAYIYRGDGADGFNPALFLHDARAEDNQNFGRSLAVANAFGRDRLIVGAKNEVFTYFRTPLTGDVDFRP
jgi:hypothetical protein